jgi:type II secretory pathway component PulM
MIKAVTRVFMERGEREWAVIAFTLIVAAFALAYAYVWLPMTRERDRLTVRVPELRAEMRAMEDAAQELKKLKAGATGSSGVGSAIQQASAAARVLDTSLEIVQLDSTRFRAAVASISAEQAFILVARLQSAAGVRVESIRVTSLADEERVRLHAMLLAAR